MIGDITGMVVAIAFWACVGAIVLGPMWMRHRERQNMQDIVRAAYEKGLPVSPELITAMQANLLPKAMRTRELDLRRGIIFIAVGLGLVGLGYGLWYGLMSTDDTAAYVSGGSVAGFGAIPALIGIGYLVLWATGKKTPPSSEATPPAIQAPPSQPQV